jgi:hypothetical protein
MNISIKTIIFVLISISLLTFSKISYSQPRGCDTLTVPGWEIPWGFPKDTVFVIKAPDIIPPVVEFEPCADPNNEPDITFIHGLGGSSASWDKQKSWTAANYKCGSSAISYEGYEHSFETVAQRINTAVGASQGSGSDQLNPNRCKQGDFVIAHSQGGVGSRHLDRFWDINHNNNLGIRKFYGLVTFGVPNAGAHIAYSKDEHAAFVTKCVSSVILYDGGKKIYDFSKKVGFLFGISAPDLLRNIDNLIQDRIAPLMLATVHAPTLNEMKPNSQEMNNIRNHNSRLRKVAFYGIEDAPECWRVMSNFTDKKAEEYPIWQAKSDNDMINKMQIARGEHIVEISNNNNKIKANKVKMHASKLLYLKGPIGAAASIAIASVLVKQNRELTKQNDDRNAAIQFLNNANTSWRYLIGSYHRDSFHIETRTIWVLTWEEKAKRGHGWVSKEARFDNINSCHNHMNNLTNHVFRVRNTNITTFNSNKKVMKFFPSDGVVLVKSQVAFPGVGNRTDAMPGDNHFQMRNSGETKRVMEKLYDGDYDDFFETPKRL